jgi:hypothetical protein
MTEVTARLDISVWVDCPHCDHMLDLLNETDTGGYDHNEEGHVLSQACPDGCWNEGHKSFEINDVECSNCNESFNVKELEW